MQAGQQRAIEGLGHVDVAVLGAGAAGLTAAFLLTRAGYSVALAERDGAVGGLARALGLAAPGFDSALPRPLARLAGAMARAGQRAPAADFWSAARHAIEASGLGLVLTGHGLRQLARGADGRWRVALGRTPVLLSAGQVVSSVPLAQLAARLQPLPAQLPAALGLELGDMASVVVSMDLPEQQRVLRRAARLALGAAHVRGWLGDVPGLALDYRWLPGQPQPDPAPDLAALGLAGAPIHALLRHRRAWPLASDAGPKALREDIARLPGLHLVGARGQHLGLDLAGAMASAVAAVAAITARPAALARQAG